VPSVAVAHISPAFQEDAAPSVFFDGVEAAFESDKIIPRFIPLYGDGLDRFGALTRTLHEFRAIGGSMCHAALDVDTANFKLCVGGKYTSDLAESFTNSGEFWFASAADRDDEASHLEYENRIVLSARNKKQIESSGLRKTLEVPRNREILVRINADILPNSNWNGKARGPKAGEVGSGTGGA